MSLAIRKICSVAFILLLSLSAAFAKKDIKVFQSIEFKNLYYLSKYEIIDLAGIGTEGKNLLVNMSSLEKALNDIHIVKSFKIIESEQRLIIIIVENQPIFLLGIRDGERNAIIELDKEYRVVSVNRAHLLDSPLIIVSQEDIKGSNISSGLKKFLDMIYNLNKSNLPVMKEIIEMDYTEAYKAKALLKGRRTVFILRPDYEGFNKLNYAVGYFDRIKYYPQTFTMHDGLGILE